MDDDNTIYLFPSLHTDENEAEVIIELIGRMSKDGAKVSVLMEAQNDEYWRGFYADIGKKSDRDLREIAEVLGPFKEFVYNIHVALRDAKLEYGANIYPVDINESDNPEVARRLRNLDILRNNAFRRMLSPSAEEDRISSAIATLRAWSKKLEERNMAMLDNIEDVFRDNAGPYLVIVGGNHAIYLKREFEEKRRRVELVKPIPERSKLDVKAMEAANTERPDLTVIRSFVETYQRQVELRGKQRGRIVR